MVAILKWSKTYLFSIVIRRLFKMMGSEGISNIRHLVQRRPTFSIRSSRCLCNHATPKWLRRLKFFGNRSVVLEEDDDVHDITANFECKPKIKSCINALSQCLDASDFISWALTQPTFFKGRRCHCAVRLLLYCQNPLACCWAINFNHLFVVFKWTYIEKPSWCFLHIGNYRKKSSHSYNF